MQASDTSRAKTSAAPALPRPDPGGPAASSDCATFEAFVSGNLERAGDWARILGLPEDDAKDIVQGSLIELWMRRAEVRASSWPAWLWKAAVFRKWAELRRRRTRRAAEPRLASHTELSHEPRPSPESELCDRQMERELRWLVEQVHESRREVARRYLLDEETLKQIAEELGLPEGTVKSRVLLARKDMRAALERRSARERHPAWLAVVKRWPALALALLVAVWRRLFVRGAEGTAPGRSPPEELRAMRARQGRFALVASAGIATAGLLASLGAGLEQMELDMALPAEEPTAEQTYRFEPYLPAWAEREREWTEARGTLPPTRGTHAQAAHGAQRDRVARAYLARVHVALYREGDRAAARAALALYEDAFPEDPFPAQHTALRVALSARGDSGTAP
jgi:RNA polymerase sigma-70 factor (ECF subfamily)